MVTPLVAWPQRQRRAMATVISATLALAAACWCIGQADALQYRAVITATGERIEDEFLYLHRNAVGFGASTYDTDWVPLVNAPGDHLLCSTGDGASTAWNPAGAIVMIRRGTCRFVLKAYIAQAVGAVGVIIGSGDYTPDDQIIAMTRNDSDPEAEAIGIPVVSIAQNDFNQISQNIENAARRNETAQANLNAQGLVDSDDSYLLSSSLRFLTILILVLPALWLGCFLFYWARRSCAARVNRVARARIAASIPLTPFHREAHMSPTTDSASASDSKRGGSGSGDGGDIELQASGGAVGGSAGGSAGGSSGARVKSAGGAVGGSSGGGGGGGGGAKRRIHNDSCTVCLEDFKESEPVKVLPCQHAFHAPCIDPWLDDRSDTCPICKQSIIVTAQHNSPLDRIANTCCCLPCVMCCNRCRSGGRNQNDPAAAAAAAPGEADGDVPLSRVAAAANNSAGGSGGGGGGGSARGSPAAPGLGRAGSVGVDGFAPLELTDEPAVAPAMGASAGAPSGAADVGHATAPHMAPSTPRQDV